MDGLEEQAVTNGVKQYFLENMLHTLTYLEEGMNQLKSQNDRDIIFGLLLLHISNYTNVSDSVRVFTAEKIKREVFE